MPHLPTVFPGRARAGLVVLTGLLTLTLSLTVAPTAAEPATDPSASRSATDAVPVQLLSVTDLHGYFGQYTTTVPGSRAGQPGQTVGGGAYLAAHLERLRERAGLPEENSLLFSAGDDFSGWPAETSWFRDEPTIEFLNLIGLDFSTLGNHEFDRNLDFLQHMTDGTCGGRPDDDLCFTDSTGEPFGGADYEYYSANAVDGADGDLVAEPYHVEQVSDGSGGTLPVGFIHTTTSTTAAAGMSYWPATQLQFLPEAARVNRYAAELQDQGVEAIVAVMHEGFSQAPGAGYNDCDQPFGPVVDMNEEISPAVDAIVTGHWHALVNCSLPDPDGNPRPVVEAANHGRLLSEINLQLDPTTGDVIRERTRAVNHANTRDVAPDPDVLALAQHWRDRMADRRRQAVAEQTGDLTTRLGDQDESTLGNLAADAYRWAADRDGGADLAVSMPGTLLRDLTVAPNPAMPGDAPGTVTFPEVAFGLVSFDVVTSDVTGRQIRELLESQWQRRDDGTTAFHPLSVSANLAYRYDPDAPLGERVAFGQVRIDGRPLQPSRVYRIAALSSNHMAGYLQQPFDTLLDARDPYRTDYSAADAIAGYLSVRSPVTPPGLDRARPVKR